MMIKLDLDLKLAYLVGTDNEAAGQDRQNTLVYGGTIQAAARIVQLAVEGETDQGKDIEDDEPQHRNPQQ